MACRETSKAQQRARQCMHGSSRAGAKTVLEHPAGCSRSETVKQTVSEPALLVLALLVLALQAAAAVAILLASVALLAATPVPVLALLVLALEAGLAVIV